MMLRITESRRAGEGLLLVLEGSIGAENGSELELACAAALGGTDGVEIDLKGVRFVDARGAALLRELHARGAVLSGASSFVAEMIDAEGDSTDGRAEHLGDGAASSEEAVLLSDLRHGKQEAFEVLVRRNAGPLLAVARRILQSEEDARDALQEAFASAFKALPTFGGGAKLSTWLHRITVNAALMKLRSKRRRPEDSIDALLPHFDEDGEWVHPGSTSHWNTPTESQIEARETRAMVRRCIEKLPETFRTALVLRDIEDLDTEEVATALGVSPNAVKIRLHRARQALRTLLEAEMREDDGGHSRAKSSVGRGGQGIGGMEAAASAVV